jgi:hypothetical protein
VSAGDEPVASVATTGREHAEMASRPGPFPLRTATLLASLGVLGLLALAHLSHRWFRTPFPVWIGMDEAYITAFGERMLQGRWLPYVDAVSHRGPVLYWLVALVEAACGRTGFAAVRAGAWLLSELSVLLVFLLGALGRRPLAGFVGAAVFVFGTTFAMQPIDGIALNGELAATPFALASTLLALVALRSPGKSLESLVWLAAGSGALATLAGLVKQSSAGHLLPVAAWWAAAALGRDEPARAVTWRPLAAFALGALTPALATTAFYWRAGHLGELIYYFMTYNRRVYMAPVTLGGAIEASYYFARAHPELVLVSFGGLAWCAARWVSTAPGWRPGAVARAFASDGLLWTSALQMAVALAGAASTFRFWGHYFVPAVPWIGLLGGWALDEQLQAASERAGPRRVLAAHALVVLALLGLVGATGLLTRLSLDAERRTGAYGDPSDEPISRYVEAHTRPTDSIFVWGFSPDYYVSSRRRAASRFLYTTFVAGMVPWFEGLTLEQENALAVPGSRELLMRELDASAAELVLDVPAPLRGRGMRRYPELAAYLETRYCYETTLRGRNGRAADVFRRKHAAAEVCPRGFPPR